MAWVCLAMLVVILVALGVEGLGHRSRLSALRQHGVAVEVTVSGCLGLASGSGITGYGYVCRGTFTLDGHQYDERIRDASGVHRLGEVLPAVVVPGDPASLTAAPAVARSSAAWPSYLSVVLAAAGALAVGLLVARGLVGRSVRSAQRQPA